jgi:hypothetical protein
VYLTVGPDVTKKRKPDSLDSPAPAAVQIAGSGAIRSHQRPVVMCARGWPLGPDKSVADSGLRVPRGWRMVREELEHQVGGVDVLGHVAVPGNVEASGPGVTAAHD